MRTTTTQFANEIIANLQLTQQEQFELKRLDVQHQVCELLGWQEDYYAAFLYGTAINFLTYKSNADEVLVRKFEDSPLFWGWFKTVWVNETAVLIPHLLKQPANFRYYCFAGFWDCKELAETVVIPRQVWKSILNTMKK
jgi:hypothetical protein